MGIDRALRDDAPRILIGFDGSGGAYDAIALAPAGEAVLVHVLPYEDPLAHHYELLPEQDSPLREDFFEEAVASLGNPAAEVRHYVGASPSRVLCDLAESGEFDFVVVGSPHRGALGRALIGSVAEALLHGSLALVAAAPRGYANTRPPTHCGRSPSPSTQPPRRTSPCARPRPWRSPPEPRSRS